MAIHLAEKPIFVIGPERSGTTLLMTMLGSHPRISVPEVAWLYPRFHPYLHTYGDLRKTENLRVLAEEMIFGLKTPFWGLDVNPRTVVDDVLSHIREESFAGVYGAMLDWYAQHEAKPRWGEKTPYNLFFIEAILKDFPNAQFIYLIRDGRDASAEYLESAFGPTNIYCAATIWKLCQDAVKPWRDKLDPTQWLDVSYETLVREPQAVLDKVCHFLTEDYSSEMLAFYKSDIAQRRAATKDHKPLGHPVSDRYIGIYKNLLSLRDQQIFAAVAGEELTALGYDVEVEPLQLTQKQKDLYIELDARIRAATLDAPEGHIVYESYNDWLCDRREERKKKGIWAEPQSVPLFSQGQFYEELITGQRAWKKWKGYLGVKRQYVSNDVVL
ncbi:sulfotransferase [Cyanobacteria bacterium FACHB-472]|nr:sulfotransferase [Cyanobacteria bacterium FACHB-472]